MDIQSLSPELNLILDINAMILCIMILVANGISIYFGLKCITCKDMYCDWIFKGNTVLSALWFVVFSYVLIMCLMGKPIFDHASFGAVVIRPLIMLSSTATAITQEIKYKRAKLYGGAKCGKKSKE